MCLLVKMSFMKTLIGKNLGQIRKSEKTPLDASNERQKNNALA